MENHFTDRMARDRALIEDYLARAFDREVRPADLQEAMAACAAERRRRLCPLPVRWR